MRLLRQTLLCLIVGCVTTVAVAWGSAALVDAEADGEWRAASRVDADHNRWLVHRWDTVTSTIVYTARHDMRESGGGAWVGGDPAELTPRWLPPHPSDPLDTRDRWLAYGWPRRATGWNFVPGEARRSGIDIKHLIGLESAAEWRAVVPLRSHLAGVFDSTA